jgi:hypothetical protein
MADMYDDDDGPFMFTLESLRMRKVISPNDALGYPPAMLDWFEKGQAKCEGDAATTKLVQKCMQRVYTKLAVLGCSTNAHQRHDWEAERCAFDGVSAGEMPSNGDFENDFLAMLQQQQKEKDDGKKWCAWCSKAGSKHLRCARCHEALYCDRECQRKAWKNEHKQACAGAAS